MIGNIFKFVGKWKSSNHSTEQLKFDFLTAVDLVTRTADWEIYAVFGILPQNPG